jgi:hypothetical protein
VSGTDSRGVGGLVVHAPEVVATRKLIEFSDTQFPYSEQCNWCRQAGRERIQEVKETSLYFAAGNKLKGRYKSNGSIKVEWIELTEPFLATLCFQKRHSDQPPKRKDGHLTLTKSPKKEARRRTAGPCRLGRRKLTAPMRACAL